MEIKKYRSDRIPREPKPCLTCGEEFIWKQKSTQKFCSNTCSQASKKTGKEVDCAVCGKSVYRSSWEIKSRKNSYCSPKCQNEDHSKRLLKNDYKLLDCDFCGETFQTTYHRRKFCSVPCASRSTLKKINSKPPAKTATKPEKEMAKLLNEVGIIFKTQYRLDYEFGWKYYDFYLPDFCILLEVDGTYWHGKGLSIKELDNRQAHTRQNDDLKDYLAAEKGFDLIRIWSDEINVTMLNKKINKVTNANK